jgi:hypothetical protein
MTQKRDPELLDNFIAWEERVKQAIRGPCVALLKKITSFVEADAQPVMKLRSGDQTIPQGPTPAAPIMHWSAGGFELSAAVDEGEEVLSVPLEADHSGWWKSQKVSDPTTPALHERSFAVSLTFKRKKQIAAMAGQAYFGRPESGMHLRFDYKQKYAELEVTGEGAKIKIGFGAVQGAARKGDLIKFSTAMSTWMSAVSAGVPVTPLVGNIIGEIETASDKVDIE